MTHPRTDTLSKALDGAYAAASRVGPHAHALTMLTYIEQVAQGTPPERAVESARCVGAVSLPSDNVLTSASGTMLMPSLDTNAAFPSKAHYLPRLRLAAADLAEEHDIVVEPGIHGGVLWIGPADRHLDEDDEEGLENLLDTVTEIFLVYGLGSVEDQVEHHHLWEHGDTVNGRAQILGEPYSGARDDCEPYPIRF